MRISRKYIINFEIKDNSWDFMYNFPSISI
jgi:hypothetical protein